MTQSPLVSSTHDALLSTLNAQRRHVLGILDGLSEESLRKPVLPSGWSCLGVVQHLALDVEQFWFRSIIAGETVGLNASSDSWQIDQGVTADSVFRLYRREAELADSIISMTPLDGAPAAWPDGLFGGMPQMNLLQSVLHVTTETACHAGHLDAARELLDGRTWLVLT